MSYAVRSTLRVKTARKLNRERRRMRGPNPPLGAGIALVKGRSWLLQRFGTNTQSSFSASKTVARFELILWRPHILRR